MELAHQRGIQLVTHERGFRKSTALLRSGGMIHELDLFDRIWSDWHDVPLTLEEVRATSQMFHNRRYGKDLNWKSFSPPPGEADTLRRKLSLDSRPVVACFTSSDDEWLTYPERREGAFPDSLDWIPATLEAICCRALEKDPRERYPSVQSMLDELKAYRLAGTSLG